tara:strand:- start:354 stop:557 length:204 start_codon:yes stop_codon:yes gene_type:complete
MSDKKSKMGELMEKDEIYEVPIFDEHLRLKEKNRKKHEMRKAMDFDLEEDDSWSFKKKKRLHNKYYR